MKKLFSMFMALMAIAMVGCEYDDSGILSEIESLKNRVQALEQLCAQSNTNIASLQALVEALQQRDYVKSVAPIAEGDKIIGYTITFAKGDPITIYHGKDGQDGQTPVVGVAKDEDGIYYWTLDGEWLTDDEGNNIPAIGGTPELKIKNDYWYVSYDGGDTWTKLGKATGETGATGATGAKGDSFFKSVKIYDDYIEFILSNGSTIVLPRDTAFEDELAFIAAMANGGTVKLTKDLTLSQAAVVATGKSIVLDLNGYNLTATSDYAIENNGTLTIIGYGKVAKAGNISLVATDNGVINNKGTLSILGGGYQFDPYQWVPEGYNVLSNGGWYYVAKNSVTVAVSSWSEFTAVINSGVSGILLVNDITYNKSYDLEKNVYIDLGCKSLEISDPALMFNIHSTAEIVNGTIKGKVYARKNSIVSLNDVTFNGKINMSSTEAALQVQGGCKSVSATNCTFDVMPSATKTVRPLSLESISSGVFRFVNCEFKVNMTYGWVYVNPLKADATVEFKNCKIEENAVIMTDASYTLKDKLKVSGNTGNFDITLGCGKAGLTDDDKTVLNDIIKNNSGTVTFYESNGTSFTL